MCIVGAGFTGLWTAYYLKQAQPDLRIVVLEREFAGFGASGRNGEQGRGVTDRGIVRAPIVLRCLEGFTASIHGQRRNWLPMNSSMVVTEPLTQQASDQIGWQRTELLGDYAHGYMYAQRTADNRIALGGRGIPYRYGSRIDHRGATQQWTITASAGTSGAGNPSR